MAWDDPFMKKEFVANLPIGHQDVDDDDHYATIIKMTDFEASISTHYRLGRYKMSVVSLVEVGM